MQTQRIGIALALHAPGADLREAFDVVDRRYESADAESGNGEGALA